MGWGGRHMVPPGWDSVKVHKGFCAWGGGGVKGPLGKNKLS